jgi:DNA invertase Pin-like site-specific DNA recombinase
MQVHHVGYQIRGFYRIAKLGHLWEMTPKDAQERLQILRFFDKHGLAATRDAFGVSRSTLYRGKQALKEAGGNPAAPGGEVLGPEAAKAF